MPILGETYRLMNSQCTCVRVTHAQERYELYLCLNSFKAIIRVVDIEAGEVVSTTEYPSDLAASKAYDDAIKIANL